MSVSIDKVKSIIVPVSAIIALGSVAIGVLFTSGDPAVLGGIIAGISAVVAAYHVATTATTVVQK